MLVQSVLLQSPVPGQLGDNGRRAILPIVSQLIPRKCFSNYRFQVEKRYSAALNNFFGNSGNSLPIITRYPNEC